MRTSARPATFAATLVVALSSSLGCGGDGLPREAVSGSVTVDEKPLKSGLITFVPTQADVPTQVIANVVDGKYSISRASGLVPGKYKVVVSSGEGSQEKKVDTNDAPGMPPVPAKQGIPAKYNSESILEANVASGASNQFDFPLVLAPTKGK